MIELTKKDLQIYKFTSKDDGRPMLMHVLVRLKDGNIELVATDSYRLVIRKVKTDAKTFTPVLIHRDYLERMTKVMGKHETGPGIWPKGKVNDTAVLRFRVLTLEEKGIKLSLPAEPEGKYPDIDKLLADVFKGNRADSVKVNPRYIAEVANYASNGNSGDTVNIETHDKYEPVVISSDDTYGLVMPLRA